MEPEISELIETATHIIGLAAGSSSPMQASAANNEDGTPACNNHMKTTSNTTNNTGSSSTPSGKDVGKIAANLKRFENSVQEVTYSNSELYHRPVLGA
jgi:hypothetical protein